MFYFPRESLFVSLMVDARFLTEYIYNGFCLFIHTMYQLSIIKLSSCGTGGYQMFYPSKNLNNFKIIKGGAIKSVASDAMTLAQAQ